MRTLEIENSSFPGAVVLLGSQGIFLLFGFLLHVILAKYYGPAVYGLYGFVMSILLWVEMTVNSGVPAAIPKLMNEKTAEMDKVVAPSLRLNLIIGLGGTIALSAFSWWIAEWCGDSQVVPLVIAASPDVAIYSLYALLGGMASGRKRFSYQGFGILAYISSKLALSGLLAASGLQILWIFVANWVASGIGAFYLWRRVRPEIHGRVSRSGYAAVLTTSCVTAANSLIFYLLVSLDLWLVKGIIRDETMVGVYVAASVLSKLPLYLFTVINILSLPLLTQAFARRDLAALTQYTNRLLGPGLALGGAISLLVSINAPLFIRLIYNESYLPGAGPLSILVWGIYFAGIASFFGLSLIAFERGFTAILLGAAAVPFTTAAAYFLIGKYSMEGAAIAILVWGTGACFTYGALLSSSPVIKRGFRLFTKTLLASGATLTVFLLLNKIHFSPGLLSSAGVTGFSLAFFGGLCFLFKIVRLGDLYAYGKILIPSPGKSS